MRLPIPMALTRMYTSRELPGWGRVYRALIGGYEQDARWQDEPPRIIRDKRNGFYRILELRQWPDRLLYFLGRWYDLEAALLIDQTLRPGESVVDVGANYGHFTLAAAAAVGAKGRVIAVEPNSVACARLRTHAALNDLAQVEIHQLGLADKAGELELEIPLVNSGNASFAGGVYENVRREICRVLPGDELLAGRAVDFLKIDVEGFESRVLTGLAASLERCRPLILMEVKARHLARAGSSRSELFARLRPLGYSAYRLGLARSGGTHYLAFQPTDESGADGDLVWVPESRTERLAPLLRCT